VQASDTRGIGRIAFFAERSQFKFLIVCPGGHDNIELAARAAQSR
jgi:hypothetical protein